MTEQTARPEVDSEVITLRQCAYPRIGGDTDSGANNAVCGWKIFTKLSFWRGNSRKTRI